MRSLFDQKAPARPGPGEPRTVLTVSQLNALVRDRIEESFPSVWIEGEISNLRKYPSGHTYFTLKDAQAQISAVLFRGSAGTLRFRAEDGLKVLARGRVSLYEPRGGYQIIVETMEPAGLGALQLAFEQLKTRLEAEGLFEAARKRPLPRLPRRIGIVTSPAGAAIRDILRLLRLRFANLQVVIAPARVQGDGAAPEIVQGIKDLHRLGGIDVLIVTRGGGSLEDLWPFNEEAVARAIAASPIPVISAVGHETDLTIADLVADLRAPTPSAAAEMVVQSKQEILERLGSQRARLLSAGRLAVARRRDALGRLEAARVFDAVRARLRDAMLRLDDLGARQRLCVERRLTGLRHQLEVLAQRMTPRRLSDRFAARRAAVAAAARLMRSAADGRLVRARDSIAAFGERLHALSPLAVLSRGYAICRLPGGGAIIKEASAAPPGSSIEVRLHRGRLECAVTAIAEEVEHGTS
ncbi:MAG TPA: exodeoxyribonuclease VII large subunit [Candidatus Polarisedimenticolia bacterium]